MVGQPHKLTCSGKYNGVPNTLLETKFMMHVKEMHNILYDLYFDAIIYIDDVLTI